MIDCRFARWSVRAVTGPAGGSLGPPEDEFETAAADCSVPLRRRSRLDWYIGCLYCSRYVLFPGADNARIESHVFHVCRVLPAIPKQRLAELWGMHALLMPRRRHLIVLTCSYRAAVHWIEPNSA